MKIYKRQLKMEYGDDRIYYRTSQIVSSIETIFNDYNSLPDIEKYRLLSVFYIFEVEENEVFDTTEAINKFESTHSMLDVYNDIKSSLALLVYDMNRNATNDYEEELSLKLKYYYNTSYKQKLKSLE